MWMQKISCLRGLKSCLRNTVSWQIKVSYPRLCPINLHFHSVRIPFPNLNKIESKSDLIFVSLSFSLFHYWSFIQMKSKPDCLGNTSLLWYPLLAKGSPWAHITSFRTCSTCRAQSSACSTWMLGYILLIIQLGHEEHAPGPPLSASATSRGCWKALCQAALRVYFCSSKYLFKSLLLICTAFPASSFPSLFIAGRPSAYCSS